MEYLFKDVDEYILVDDLQRILNQPFDGVFQAEIFACVSRGI